MAIPNNKTSGYVGSDHAKMGSVMVRLAYVVIVKKLSRAVSDRVGVRISRPRKSAPCENLAQPQRAASCRY